MADELDREAAARRHGEENRPVPDLDRPGADMGTGFDEDKGRGDEEKGPDLGDAFRSGS